MVLTFEYLLKADLVLKLAHRDSRNAGARKMKYRGSSTTGSFLLLS
jgi:hypothetical protein